MRNIRMTEQDIARAEIAVADIQRVSKQLADISDALRTTGSDKLGNKISNIVFTLDDSLTKIRIVTEI